MAKNFLSAIKGAFVNEVPDAPQEVVSQPMAQPTIQPVVQPTMLTSTLIQPVNQNGSVVGQVDSEMLERLCVVLDEKNLPGPDYLELKSAANDSVMQSSIPDETLRFTCSYISMKVNAPGLNKGVIIGSIEKYTEYLEEERKIGLSQLAEKWKCEVDDKQFTLDKAQEEMIELQKALAEKVKFINDTNSEITVSKNECTVKKANFNATVDYLISGLNTDKEKLNNILKD